MASGGASQPPSSIRATPTAHWLAATATDRELVHLGKPQRSVTQSSADNGGVYKRDPVAPTVTDEERARWNVPSLADQQRWVDARNAAR